MIRIKLLTVCCLFLFLYSCKKEGEVKTISLSLNPTQQRLALPKRFIGLSYEMTEITSPSYFSPDNATLIQLIKNLGDGVLRIGASGVDRTYWTNSPRSSSSPDNSITTSDVDRFAAFDKQIDWPVIFGLNLADYSPGTAANEATYVSNKLGSSLMDFEIGNEPDTYEQVKYRSPGYNYSKFKVQFDAYVKAIRGVVPDAPVSGPDISHNTNWCTSFAADEKNTSKLLTAHHYGMNPYNGPSIGELLGSETSLEGLCQQLEAAASSNGMLYRIAECNSAYSGGVPGISNAYASALWGLDMMWTIVSHGGSGVNFHGGDNGVYTPIALVNGSYIARPLYYGMMAFEAGAQGNIITVNSDTHGLNIKAYAAVAADSSLWLTVINKTAANSVTLQVNAGRTISKLDVQRLQGPGLNATDRITFAGGIIGQDGTFTASDIEHYLANENSFTLNLPSASAAVIHMQ